jgi:hypothetical protein
MIDGLYLKSLISTLVVYFLLVGALATFVFFTGAAGVFLIFLIIVLLVCYFYGCFRSIDFRKKG